MSELGIETFRASTMIMKPFAPENGAKPFAIMEKSDRGLS
jgi:hypothetical protein